MLLASCSAISKAFKKLYKPKEYKEVMDHSMWKIWKEIIQEVFQSFIENLI